MTDRMLDRGVVAGFVSTMLMVPAAATADAVLDGTTGSTGSFAGDFEIPAAVGRQEGGNLFHSFERFSVLQGESATFTGPAGIENVISRVTGGDVSTINGLLASTIPGADFFFLNPAGVVFGPEATLNVQGSFHVSTADELRFTDGEVFSAADPAASSFTMAAPEAFGFLGADPAAITVTGGALAVLPNERLDLSGGDIDISGGLLFAPSGTLDLTAQGGDGDVAIRNQALVSVEGDGAGRVHVRAQDLAVEDRSAIVAPSFGGAVRPGGVDIRLSGTLMLTQSLIAAGSFGGATDGVVIDAADVVLDGGQIDASSFSSGQTDGVTINASERLVIGGTVRFDQPGVLQLGLTPGIFAFVRGSGAGGDITIGAETLVITDAGVIDATTRNVGPGGSITVGAGSLDLSEGGAISAEAFDGGPAGDVTIVASSLKLDESFIGANSRDSALPGADAGTVTIDAGRIEFINDGRVFNGTDGPANGGDIIVNAGTIVADAGSDPFPQVHTGISASANPGSSGVSGDVVVTADRILLLNGGEITSDTAGEGAAGEVSIDTGVLRVDAGFIGTNSEQSAGEDADGGTVIITADRIEFINGGRIFNGTDGAGEGGDVIVTAGTMEADDGINLTGFHTGISASANAGSTGSGGDVMVTADQILLLNGAEISSDTDSVGAAGEVSVFAERIDLRDGGRIFTTSTGSGDAGDILVSADRLTLRDGEISTQADIAGGGRIVLDVDRILDLNGSGIVTSVFGGVDTTAGDITIDPEFVVLNGSRVVANAREGTGGNIQIVADHFFTTPGTVIDASSQLGIDGTVEIDAPDVDLTSELAVLSTAFIDVSGLLRESCAARSSDQTSSFVTGGSQGLVPDPAAPLAGAYAARAPRDAGFQHWTSKESDCRE